MRVTTTKSKFSESFYINYAYIDKNGKSTSKIFKKLGTLNELKEKLGTDDRDEVMKWAKEQARIATEMHKAESENVLVPLSPKSLINLNERRSFNCGYLFLQKICSDLRIDNICRNIKGRHKFKYDIQAIITDLVYARILNPSSKKSSYSYCQSLLEMPKYSLDNVYDALQILADESDYIQSDLYRNSNFLHARNKSVLYYDCTNFFFEIEQEDELRKYGKSKEHRPSPIVELGLFMDADGFPLAFDIYPGNQNEQTTLKPLEQKVIRDFECSKFIFCSDSGLGSKSNRQFNDLGDRSYVITQSLKKMKTEDRDIALNPAQYRKLGCDKFINLSELDLNDPDVFNTVYYKEIPVTNGPLEETVIVTFSPKYRDYQRKIREGQIERARKMITSDGKIKKNRKNPNDPSRFIETVHVTSDAEVAENIIATLNTEAIAEEEKYDGFYAVITDFEDDPAQIIAINKRRWQIEECFRIMKTEFRSRPVYVSTEKAIKAHFLTCFIALLVYRILENQLNNKYTVTEIVNTLSEMKLTDIGEMGYIPSYTRTALTDALHENAGFRTDTQIVKKSKLRSIIKSSKDKK